MSSELRALSTEECHHPKDWVDLPTVSVLVLNWNGKDYLERCLESLQSDHCKHVEVLVVDNGSTDDSVAFVRENFPRVGLVANVKNLGFSVAYNVAATKAQGRFLIFLNNDTWVEPGWLDELVHPLVKDEDIGLTTANLVLRDTRLIDNAGGYLKLWAGSGPLWAGRTTRTGKRIDRVEPFFACGAAMAVSSDLFGRLGGFDSAVFAYGEDLDLSWRARLSGYKVRYAPGAVVHHHLSASWGSFNPTKVRMVTRHQIRAMLKCLSPHNVIHAVPAYALLSLAKGFGLSVLRRNPSYLAQVLGALLDVLRNLDEIRSLRKETQELRILEDRSVLQSEEFGLLDSPSQLATNLRIAEGLLTDADGRQVR